MLDWLVKTASTCCDISSIMTSLRSASTRRHAATGAVIEPRTAELVRLALVIARAKPSTPTPWPILETARDVVSLRQDVAADYAAESLKHHNNPSASDQGHQHFIHVLQHVHNILAPGASLFTPPTGFIGTETGKRKKPAKEAAAPKDITNTFANLDVEEPQSGKQGSPKSALPVPTPKTDYSKATFKLDKKEEDSTLTVICHLQDLHDVRLFVK